MGVLTHLISFEYITWSGFAVFLIQFSVMVVFTFPPMVYKIPFSPHPHQHLSSFVFLVIAILTCVRWHLIVVLSCISPMISYVEHLFMYLLAFCMSSFEKYKKPTDRWKDVQMSVWVLSPFLIRLFVFFLLLNGWVPYIFWILTP